MKKLLTLATAILIACAVNAQNIVPNGNFDTMAYCPTGASQPWACAGWGRPSSGSSDFFDTCFSGIGVDIPTNFRGYQPALSGSGYMGLYAFFRQPFSTREYISTSIPETETGAYYRVSMYVSLANYATWAINGLGVLFYVDDIGADTVAVARIDRMPQVDYRDDGIVNDTVNWVHLVDTFQADSAYKRIAIGNFLDTGDMQASYLYGDSTWGYSYYYIENVMVEKITVEAQSVSAITGISTQLYPNPFSRSAKLRFSNPLSQKHVLSVYDIQGRQVRNAEIITESEAQIERQDLAAGCYFFELRREDGATGHGKLIVE